VDLADTMESKFRFSIIVAKRAKQLINGAKPLVDIGVQNPLTIAIEEANRGLITIEMLDEANIYLEDPNSFTKEDSEKEIEDSDELPEEEFSMDKLMGSEGVNDSEEMEVNESTESETGEKEE